LVNTILQETAPAIQIEHVTKRFRKLVAVNDISLRVNQGEFVALLGPNGAGKTTLVEMLEGLQQPSNGKINVFGLHWKDNQDFLHRQLGISLQETRFIDKLRVSETLDLFASFYGLPTKRVKEILSLIGLEDKAKAFVVNLSGGQRQRLALGVGLLNKPRLLLLDEPTTGLDPTSRRELWKILIDLRKHEPISMILTTHYMEEASFLCERIIIMDKGNIIAQGTLDELLSTHDQGEIIEFTAACEFDSNHFLSVTGVRKIFQLANGKHRLIVDNILDVLPSLLRDFESFRCGLLSLECRKFTLDDLFVSLTGRTLD
jgi:ABC-2 type transport system ATP-binding protein